MKETKILSLADQRHHQIASLLRDMDHDSLPPSLSTYFKKRNVIHNQHTRIAHDGKYNIPKTNTITHGSRSFQVQGSLILNRLKSLDIYKDAESKTIFLNNLKKSLIDNY